VDEITCEEIACERNHPMGRIEEYIEKEKKKTNWLQKLSANYPVVTDTILLAQGYALPENTHEKLIRPSLLRRLIYLFAFLVVFSGWLILVIPMRGKDVPLGVDIIFIPFNLIMSISFLLMLFLKKFNYRIQINRSGITLREDFIPWEDIVETAIMRKPEARGDHRYLVIFKRDGTDLKSDLYMFGISDRKLAATIEYFKNN
jgi:hypothetical protein